MALSTSAENGEHISVQISVVVCATLPIEYRRGLASYHASCLANKYGPSNMIAMPMNDVMAVAIRRNARACQSQTWRVENTFIQRPEHTEASWQHLYLTLTATRIRPASSRAPDWFAPAPSTSTPFLVFPIEPATSDVYTKGPPPPTRLPSWSRAGVFLVLPGGGGNARGEDVGVPPLRRTPVVPTAPDRCEVLPAELCVPPQRGDGGRITRSRVFCHVRIPRHGGRVCIRCEMDSWALMNLVSAIQFSRVRAESRLRIPWCARRERTLANSTRDVLCVRVRGTTSSFLGRSIVRTPPDR